MARIELKHVGHAYNRIDGTPRYALYPLDLAWEDGGTYALLGPSGCGKTTMLNIVSGLLTPSQGQVLIDGRDVTGIPAARRNIAQVFQFPVVYPSKSVYENLAFPLRCRNMASREIDRRVNEIAELLDLDAILQRPARKLTPDAKQLISLGRGLVRDDVAVILMDEPLTVIDPQLKFHLRRKLKDISARHGHTLVYVTHDQNEAMTLAEQVIVMDNGHVVQVGTPQDLFENPAHTHVGYFIGSPSMNFLPCVVVGGEIRCVDQPVARANLQTDALGADLTLGIRPEFVDIVAPDSAGSLAGRVADIQDLGAFSVVTVVVAEGLPVRAKVKHAPFAQDVEVGLRLSPDWIRLFANGALVSGAAISAM
ncbi:MAG: ABC transporter ATP-binding protein [Devosia sp.]